jgi:hypothetical protein
MLHIITCYFNPLKYKTRLNNYNEFRGSLEKQGIKPFVIESYLDQSQIDSDIKIKTSDFLWHKERLFNIAIENLPCCDKVAWLDCDIIFHDDQWYHQIDRMLDDVDFVQPYETAQFLDKDKSIMHTSKSCICEYQNCEKFSQGYLYQGHPGFAAAARKNVIVDGLYDKCIAGHGDRIIITAATRDHWAINRWNMSPLWKKDIETWLSKNKWSSAYLPITLSHLWHGKQKRRYASIFPILRDAQFDIDQLQLDNNECYTINNEKAEAELQKYFKRRAEDGIPFL